MDRQRTPGAARTDICRRLGQQVRALRLARGWSQEKLALVTGVHRNTIGDIERGEVNIGLGNLEKLARGLAVGVGVLLDGD